MDFNFNSEQLSMKKMLRDFVKKEVQPGYAERDKSGKFPRDLWKKTGDLGLIGMTLPVEEGGQGADCLTAGLASEELGRGDPNMGTAVFVVGELVANLIQNNCTEKLKKEWLGPLLAGDAVPAFALTEPHCGTDAAAMKSRAVRKGDKYILNGEKSGVTLMMDSDVVIVFAKTDPDAGAKGVSGFIVPCDMPGVTRQWYEDMGSKCVRRGSIFMDDVEISSDNLLGKEGEGFKYVMRLFDFSRFILSLICLGSAQITLEETIQYTKERHAFGRPLAKFEGVSFPITEHYSIIESVRWLCYRGLWLRDQGQPHTEVAAMSKWMAPRFSVNAIRDCLLMHGHYGYTQEFPFEQRLRDVMGVELADGTSQVSKIVITRELFGREYLPY